MSFFPPVTAETLDTKHEGLITLELQDGTVYQGYSFGAKKSIAGELVFQTGMVGAFQFSLDLPYTFQYVQWMLTRGF
jgi:carbamoyl-phosphate synthase/aspartate carbamoyltransferase